MNYGSGDDDFDEMVIGGDEDEEKFQPDEDDMNINPEVLGPVVGLCEAFLPDFEPFSQDSTIYFCIPKKYLPLSLQVACGFYYHPIIINVSVQLSFNKWNMPPASFNVQSPIYKSNFVGFPLIKNVITNFFSSSYKPRNIYKSELYIFKHSGIVDKNQLKILVDQNFDPQQASEALSLCNNNLQEARQFLLTGKVPNSNSNEFDINYRDDSFYIPSYDECPFIYLILEIVEAFLDLNDHCCICREKLPFAGIRPQHCDNQLCVFGYNEIGLCSSVAMEIKRDPLAADLVFSFFSGSFANTEFMDPKPSPEILSIAPTVFNNLPSMDTIAQQCQRDIDISQRYGSDALSLLRWVLMTNKSQLISLPNSLKIPNIPTDHQFMTLISTPQNELEFQSKKKSYGSCFLWHGSGGDRWHSIFHNGLKNMSRIGKVAHGAAHGEGIYLAHNSSTSIGYSQPTQNLYRNSKIGNKIQCIALCEIANMPSNILRNHGGIKTLIDEKACIVRFIFSFQRSFSIDTISQPLQKVPTLQEVMEILAQSH